MEYDDSCGCARHERRWAEDIEKARKREAEDLELLKQIGHEGHDNRKPAAWEKYQELLFGKKQQK